MNIQICDSRHHLLAIVLFLMVVALSGRHVFWALELWDSSVAYKLMGDIQICHGVYFLLDVVVFHVNRRPKLTNIRVMRSLIDSWEQKWLGLASLIWWLFINRSGVLS